MHKPYVRIRAEILAPVADHRACAENPGEGFIFNADPGKGFIVLEAYIIMRTVFLDKVIFEKQGILFGGYDNIFDVGDFSDQHLDFSADRCDLDKIRTDPLLQVLCLAYVYDAVFIVKILVHPRFIRQGPDNGLKLGEVFIEGAQLF